MHLKEISLILAGNNIDLYAVIDVTRPINGNIDYLDKIMDTNDFLSYYHAARSVTNAGIGFKQTISPSLFVLGGFRTDFTSGSNKNIRFLGDKFKINQIHMDKYHVSVGPVVKMKRFDVLTGIQYSFGRNRELDPVINYTNPVEFIPQTGQSLEGIRNNQASASLNEIALFMD